MKKLLFTLILITFSTLGFSRDFDELFENKTLRIDYIHAGNAESESYYFESLKEEPHFAGSRINLIDDNNLGLQYLKVYDIETQELIYSRGFCVLFTEWQATPEAKVTSKAYRESMVMPYPKKPVRIEIHSRNKQGLFEKKFEHQVDPSSIYIEKRTPSLPWFDVHKSGEPATCIDIVFIAEGYGADEQEKFKADCENFRAQIFTFSPLKEKSHKFNIRGVWSTSIQSGVTNPGENSWRSTALNAKFYTFESERYQMVDDFQRVRDIAANVPYDLIYIISNTDKYGGGGIYNFYGISSSSHPTQAGRVFVHEFGHLLLGLADEYESDASVEDFYPAGVEPWEINIARDLDLATKPIWRSLLDDSTPVPTVATEENSSLVGVYQGGGYASEGIYRPWVNCMMRTLNDGGFCPVCRQGISDMIDFICE
ncbi:MAG: M64 family metallopeptidase [Rikenellaceae bacterium]